MLLWIRSLYFRGERSDGDKSLFGRFSRKEKGKFRGVSIRLGRKALVMFLVQTIFWSPEEGFFPQLTANGPQNSLRRDDSLKFFDDKNSILSIYYLYYLNFSPKNPKKVFDRMGKNGHNPKTR